jgi:DNA (cytosine-5)-methyltransferase 1
LCFHFFFVLSAMRQPSLFEVLGASTRTTEATDGLEVYDFFCGAGGFSEGARQAGHRVVWACDDDADALATHAANHPEAAHQCATLPLARAAWPFPTDGRCFHVHFSPPCQRFSKINNTGRIDGDKDAATALVAGSVATALACGASSWSLEQVPARAVLRVLAAARARDPARVAYAKIDMALLGVPQTRTRVIAGSPRLVAHLLRQCARANVRPVTAVIGAPRGEYVRNSCCWGAMRRSVVGKRIHYVAARPTDHCHRVSGPAPTVLARRALAWVARRGDRFAHSLLRPEEAAALQTFPPTYRWPDAPKERRLREVGNAFPPLVALRLMEGAC